MLYLIPDALSGGGGVSRLLPDGFAGVREREILLPRCDISSIDAVDAGDLTLGGALLVLLSAGIVNASPGRTAYLLMDGSPLRCVPNPPPLLGVFTLYDGNGGTLTP